MSMYGKVTGENGNLPRNMDNLENHSFVTFNIELQAARQGTSTETITGERVTEAEFLRLMNKTRSNVSSMGETFNETLVTKGLEYIRGNA
ncbi:MAG: hypothetical protein JKY17_07745 [Magnetovibrio sp.]|nr:hypothetical protein [Magnetovibrio sp.]